MARRLLPLTMLLLAACGGGSGGGDPAPDDGDLSGPRPDVALILSSGHSPSLPDYLTAGGVRDQLVGAIEASGRSVRALSFVDSGSSYLALVAALQQIHGQWIEGQATPTRVVVVGHSHGCVRSHAALRAVPECPVDLLVDLDGSSAGWSLALVHGAENALIGGAPEGAYPLGVQITCPDSGVGSAGGPHDLEDVVFPQVREAFEVRSGDVLPDPSNPFQWVEYDERWNARLDGSTTGLACHYSGTGHGEVALAGGLTLARVEAWILERLSAGP